MKILDRIGDVNALEYGGGFIYDSGYGPHLEYTYGLETETADTDFSDVDPGDEEAKEIEIPIYTVDLEKNAFAFMRSFDWVDWGDVADFIGMDKNELRAAANTVAGRASMIEAAAGYHGWGEFDHDPDMRNVYALNEQWDDYYEQLAHNKRLKGNPSPSFKEDVRREIASRGYSATEASALVKKYSGSIEDFRKAGYDVGYVGEYVIHTAAERGQDIFGGFADNPALTAKKVGGTWVNLKDGTIQFRWPAEGRQMTFASIEDTRKSYGNKSGWRYETDHDGERHEGLREAKASALAHALKNIRVEGYGFDEQGIPIPPRDNPRYSSKPRVGPWGNDPAALVNWMDRSDIQSVLENYGFAVYDSESDDELRAALLENVLDGTIPMGDLG
jgi:hypothetical protein